MPLRFVFIGIFFLLALSSRGQSAFVVSNSMKADLYKAESLLKSYKNDSALLYIEKLLIQLKKTDNLDSYLGLRVRLAEATALEQKNQGLTATPLLHEIIDQSNQKSTSDIYVKASLLMALVHETQGLKENSLEYLNRAKATIDKYGIDSLYVYYAIRMASWKRFHESKESAIPYAQEILELAPKYSLRLEEAIGHMLMQFIFRTKDPRKSLYHSLKALEIYKELDDFLGQSYMYNAASISYLSSGEYTKAMVYNDSSIALVKSRMNDKVLEKGYLGLIYIHKGKIFKGLGNSDSALFYTSLGYKMELERVEARFSEKITELEILNKSEKKEEQYLLKLKQRNIILIAALLVLALAFSIIYLSYSSYKKQKRYGAMLTQQNQLITEQAEHLKKSDQSKSLFYANASHELRTPLTLILGPLNTLLQNDNLSESEKAQLLSIAREGGMTLKNLISQILDLSKLDGGNMRLHLKPTKVHAFFETWLAQFETLKYTKRLQYLTEIHVPEDLIVLLDGEKCRQIISNLISNAIKFTEKDGKVYVSIKYEECKLKIGVSDTGIGIAAADLPYIFDRYFQANNKDELAQGGMGIGLALCRDYVALMDGTIRIESAPGKGSSFFIEFPVDITVEKPEEDLMADIAMIESGQVINSQIQGKPTVLVVEDNYTLQEYLYLLLNKEYNVLLAENGEVALEVLHNNEHINLIISDLMMPVMDGYQLLDALKTNEKTSGIPVIMLTARAEKDAQLKALKIGVDDYLTKPFSEEELRVRISNLLKNYDIRKQISEEEYGEKLPDGLSETDKEWMMNFQVYINKIFKKSPINIPDIAADFAMSESGLLRKLKRLTGLSPQQYIQEIRLQEAFALLNEDKYTIQQIALNMGYKDPRTFSRAFKNRFGILPSTVIST